MKEINPSLSSITSNSEWLNSKDIDIVLPIEYDSSLSIKGGAMIPDALEYYNEAKISITGGDARKRNFVKKAARWMLGYTLGNRLATNISLSINLSEDLKNTSIYGSVIWEDANHRPREFDMDLCNYLKDRMLYRVLAHEIVHIRQYATGDLKDLATHADYCKWKNKMVKAEGRGRGSYFDLPWEVEARRDQEIILREWKQVHGYHFKQKTGELYCDYDV